MLSYASESLNQIENRLNLGICFDFEKREPVKIYILNPFFLKRKIFA